MFSRNHFDSLIDPIFKQFYKKSLIFKELCVIILSSSSSLTGKNTDFYKKDVLSV
jgi:hypothetical protein